MTLSLSLLELSFSCSLFVTATWDPDCMGQANFPMNGALGTWRLALECLLGIRVAATPRALQIVKP